MRRSLGLCLAIMPERFILAVAMIAVLLPVSIYAQSKKKSKRPEPPEYAEAKIRADTPQGMKKCLQKSEATRRGLYDVLVKDFEELAIAVESIEKRAKLPRGQTNVYLPAWRWNGEGQRQQIQAQNRELLAKKQLVLEDVGGTPAYVCHIGYTDINWGTIKVPNDTMERFDKLETGVIFRFSEVSVISVAEPEEMLVSYFQLTGMAPPLHLREIDIWFSGFSTAGITDGAVFHPKVPVLVSGTKTYTSAGGASRTVFLAVAFDPSEYLEPLKKKSDAAETAGKFAGKWKIVNDKGVVGAYFTLDRAFTAKKSHVPDATGKWELVGDEARITWSDGWKDILRPEKGRVAKIAFGPGKNWDDKPDNTQWAIKE